MISALRMLARDVMVCLCTHVYRIGMFAVELVVYYFR